MSIKGKRLNQKQGAPRAPPGGLGLIVHLSMGTVPQFVVGYTVAQFRRRSFFGVVSRFEVAVGAALQNILRAGAVPQMSGSFYTFESNCDG